MNSLPWLTVLWLVPLVGAVAIVLLPAGAGKLARYLGVAVSVAVLAVSIGIALAFNTSSSNPTAGYRHSAPDTPSASTASRWFWCC
jgi:NADH-quinone oxidoreductase subunit M